MRAIDPDIDLEWVLERYSYDPHTGEITHKIGRCSVRQGQRAGNVENNGYIRLRVRRHKVLAHRLAWFMHFGTWPLGEIDHLNRLRSDNRISNLRDTSSKQNNHNRSVSRNNKSGFPGVRWRGHLGKWQAVIQSDGRRKSLGHFDLLEEAVASRRHAEFVRAVEVAKG